jgi:hypothetical protein
MAIAGLTSCNHDLSDHFGVSDNPSEGGTPTVDDVIKYGFKVTDLNGDDKTTLVTSLKMSTDDGPIAEAEVSGGKITIKAEKLSGITTAIDFWFEAEIGGKPYIAKVNINPTTLSPESDKTLEMATLGDVILSDGKFAVAGTAGQLAKIAYLGDDAETNTKYNHGLALALEDVSVTKKWCDQTTETCLDAGHQYNSEADAKGDMAGIANTVAIAGKFDGDHYHDAAIAATNYNSSTYPDGTSEWFLPSAGQWDKMATAAGGYANLKTNAGLQDLASYWSSTEYDASLAWFFNYNGSNWETDNKNNEYRVRACLAF